MLKKMFLPMALALKFQPPAELSAKVVLDVSGMFLRGRSCLPHGFSQWFASREANWPPGTGNHKCWRHNSHWRKSASALAQIGCSYQGTRWRAPGKWRGRYGAITIFLLYRCISSIVSFPPNGAILISISSAYPEFEGVPVMTVQLWLDRQVTGIDNILFCPDGVIPVDADLGNTTPDYSFKWEFTYGVRRCPCTRLL